jgi:uncharacterized protein (DUF1800 family)
MSKSFFRKVAFGLSSDARVPDDPLKWALEQIKIVPPIGWKGEIPSGEEQLSKNAHYIYQNRKVLRQQYKNDPIAYKKAKKKLQISSGFKYYEHLEYAIRHDSALNTKTPVYARLTHFWGNHFAITDKNELPIFATGPMHREIIRPALIGNFEDLLYNVTTSWAMIHNLDNSKSVGPDSKSALNKKQRGKTSSINENHARELMELHSISPKAAYNQRDVVELTYLMTGWRHPHSKKRLEANPVIFEKKFHQPGSFTILGKTYDQEDDGEGMLRKVIKDLATHPECKKFITTKLCKHFITERVTSEMINPIIMAWNISNGSLPVIHEALLKQVFLYANKYNNFQLPENWLLQVFNMWGMSWPSSPTDMTSSLGFKPDQKIRIGKRILRQLGHIPFRARQPNGFSDSEADWISPELLFRRIGLLNKLAYKSKKVGLIPRLSKKELNDVVSKNFHNTTEIMQLINKVDNVEEQAILLFSSRWMLRA